MMSEEKELFNQAASSYDETFTNSHIGKAQRLRVYYWLDKCNFFERTKAVFEINCGTGEDAHYFSEKGLNVVATDQSSKMIELAQSKFVGNVDFLQMDFNDLQKQSLQKHALFSNFGGLNCVSGSDLEMITKTIGDKQQKGDLIVLVIMPKFCFMEGLYMISKFKFGKLFRRNSDKPVAVNVDGVTVETFYHSPRFLKKSLKTYYKIERVNPVAFFLPPSYLEGYFKKRLGMLRFLNRLEKMTGRVSFLAGWSDHYIIIGERK